MKKNTLWLIFSLFLAAMLVVGCGGTQTQVPAVELNISAAISLKDALTDIQKDYQQKNPNVKLVYNLGASGTLQQQIEKGSPADIFISAAPKQMDTLAAKNLIDTASRKNLLENELVLIVPNNSTVGIASFEDLGKANVQKLAIGETKVVPAGQYAKQVLDKLKIWNQVSDKIIMSKDVREVVTYVETGNVDAGIVYKTDAINNAKVKVVAAAPQGSHKKIVYPAAILIAAKQPKEAADFLAYLSGPEAKAIFEKYGFIAN